MDNKTITLSLISIGFLSSIAVAENFDINHDQTLVPTPRIIGGIPTGLNVAPATVALLRTSRVTLDGDLFQAQYCGGTVIAERWVLTAAHCVVDLFGNQLATNSVLVLSGSEDLDNPVNQPVGLDQIFINPAYSSAELGNDIALLHLTTAVNVTPVAIDTSPINLNDAAFIAGWGAVNPSIDGSSQNFPKLLRGAYVDMSSGTECARLYPEFRDYANASNICAGVPEGGKDSCQGDSGGPLYRVNERGEVTAVTGITSWGVSCGEANTPGFYTNVASYVGWIQTTVSGTDQASALPLNDQPANDGLGLTFSSSSNVDASSTQSALTSDPDRSEHVFSAGYFSPLHTFAVLLMVMWRRLASPSLRS